MSELMQGLQLSVMGILITFASLGVLILVMVVLRELFAEKPAREEPCKEQVDLLYYQEDLRLRVAGIAVAVAFLKRDEKRAANLGALLESSQGKSQSLRSHNE